MPWSSPSFAYLAVFIGVLGHASSEFVAVLSGVSGPEVSSWRFLLGGFGLVAVALLVPGSRDMLTPLRREGPRLLLLSAFGVSAAYLLFHWALDFATVVQVATLVTTIPIFVGLANLIINKAPITAPKLVTGLAAVAGIALLITDGALGQLVGDTQSLIGIAMCLGTAALVSAYAVLAKPLIGEYGALRITALTMAMGGVLLWLGVGAFWGIWVNPAALFDRPPVEAWSLFAIAIWNTTITQYLWIGGLAAVPGITRGSYLFFLKPVIAALLALFILSQPIAWLQWAAIVVICGAVVVEMLWPKPKPRDG